MTLLASLARRWEALSWQDGPLVPDNGLAPQGLSPANIGFELVIARNGRLLEHRLLDAPREKPARFRVMHLPTIERSGKDPVPAFLWDKTAYLLGATNIGSPNEPKAGQGPRTANEHAAFVAVQRTSIGNNPDEGLQAVLAFLDAWSPERFEGELSPEYLDLNGVFRLDGDRHAGGTVRYVHEREAARAIWMPVDPDPGEHAPMCLVDGRPTAPARLHSKIKDVYGGQGAGAPIASVNKPSFRSYRWAEGLDAPVSPRAAHAYRTALNALLARGGEGRGRLDRGTTRHGARRGPGAGGFENKGVVGDTTVAFWAETPEGAPDRAGEALLGAALGAPDPLAFLVGGVAGEEPEAPAPPEPTPEDAERRRSRQQQALGELIAALAAGTPAESDAGRLDPGTVINVLGLTPNEGRISVRFYHSGSLGTLAGNVAAHWEDMALASLGDRRPTARALIGETAVHRWDAGAKRWKVAKNAEPPKRLAGELLRAILEGTKYPETLAAAILLRIRSERGHVNARRAAMLKAVFNRNHAKRNGGKLMPGLDRERRTPGYLLGQLFALYEKAEDASQASYDATGKRTGGGRNATLRDRYFTAASAGPARVFATLANSYVHDVAKLRKSQAGGLAHWFDSEIGRVMAGLPIDLPNTLSAPEQSEFVVGYWHMRTERREGTGAAEPDPIDQEETTP